MASAETACPHCGHSPISAEDERCPGCFNWLRELPRGRAQPLHNDAEQEMGDAVGGTRIGGLDLITSDAEAHPGLAAALLACLGLFLGLLGLRALPALGSPLGYLGLGALDLLLAILLKGYPTFGRPLVTLAAPLQAAALLYLGRSELGSPQVLSLALAPLLVLAGVSGEPGPRGRGLAFSVGLALLCYSGTVRLGSRYFGAVGPLIDAPRAGFRLALPVGYAPLADPNLLEAYVGLPNLDPEMAVFAFADPARATAGLWGVAPPGRYQMARLAQGFAEALAAPSGAAKPVSVDLPVSGRPPQLTYERGLGPGRVASVTAVRLPDERVAVLLVAGPTTELDSARLGLARGAQFAPARGGKP